MTIKVISLLIILLSFSCSHKNDAVNVAREQTAEQNADKNARNADFLIEMADARMMDREEGRLAARLGTTKEIRSYGRRMVNEQPTLLSKLQGVAQNENVSLPNKLSEEKSSALKDLGKLRGKEFDREFSSMISIDHERDVRAFSQAAKAGNGYSPQVRNFAKRNLPVIEGHLDAINGIKL